MNVLVVGEAPGRRSGGVLEGYERKLSGLSSLRRVNLVETYPGPAPSKGALFPAHEAARAAIRLDRRTDRGTSFVLVGRRVAAAFGFRRHEYDMFDWFARGGRSFVVVPHPSGVNTWWNDPAHREIARRFMAGLDTDTAAV